MNFFLILINVDTQNVQSTFKSRDGGLFLFRANQLLLFLLVAEWLAEKQQIHILLSLVWSDRSSNPRLTTPRGERTADPGL